MKWTVRWTNRALRTARRLDRPTRVRILETIDLLTTEGRGDLKRLKGEHQGILRLRVGGWRVLLVEERQGELVIRSILPRGDAY